MHIALFLVSPLRIQISKIGITKRAKSEDKKQDDGQVDRTLNTLYRTDQDTVLTIEGLLSS